MTETSAPPHTPNITPTGAIMLRAMLTLPKDDLYMSAIANAIGRPNGTLVPILRDIERAGWVTSKLVRVSDTTRRYYTFTPAGRKAARAEVQTWDFDDQPVTG